MFVRKLDSPEQFAEIKTGLKSTSALKRHERERHSVWFNHFRERGELVGLSKANIEWVGENWPTILAYIRESYAPPKASASTYRNHLEGLANILLALDKDKFKETVRPLYNQGLSLQQRLDKDNEASELSARDQANFVPFGKLVEKREQLYAAWMADPGNLKLNIYHLILALNTLIPPLRLDWLDMIVYPPRIVEGKLSPVTYTAEPPPENNQNYLWQEAPGQWAVVMNHDKIEGRRRKKSLPRQIFQLADEVPGVTDGRRLSALLTKSLEAEPRNYVLIGIRSKQWMRASAYGQALGEMFKPKKPLQNLLRKAYVNFTHRMKINGMELPESKLKAIADRMRHTVEVARGSYRKVNLSLPEDAEVKEEWTPGELPPHPPPPPIFADEPEPSSPIVPAAAHRTLPSAPPVLAARPYFDPAKYSREYRLAHAEDIRRKKEARYAADKHKILRAKLLSNLNKGLVKRPTSVSIAKYGLRQNADTGHWESSQAD